MDLPFAVLNTNSRILLKCFDGLSDSSKQTINLVSIVVKINYTKHPIQSPVHLQDKNWFL